MISPEGYYEMFLKGKTADEIKKEIRRLRRQIRKLQKEVDDPNHEGWAICPSPYVQLEMHRLYLQKAVETLMDTEEYLTV